jgi:L-ribulose-5-phosphate 3-epimerase
VPSIGFMQGRLSPKPVDRIQAFPQDTWREEFPRARELGFQCIELIYDTLYLEQNPLNSDFGRRELRQISQDWKINLHSICADYFMVRPLLDQNQTERRTNFEAAIDLFHIAREISCPVVEFPFVDSSSLRMAKDLSLAIEIIQQLAEKAKSLDLKISIESDLGPIDFKNFISNFDQTVVGINLDIGNSSALGYDTLAECAAYGGRLFNVHIKDRVLGGTTVPLGQGSADFDRSFQGLKKVNYRGDFILQTAPSPDYMGAAKQYRMMVDIWINRFGLAGR